VNRLKIMTLQEAVRRRALLREARLTLAVTNGCFDVLHRGHAEALQAARAEADALIVLLNSDASVRALKGPERPVFGEQDRAVVLGALECVDGVVVFAGTDCGRELAALAPDVYVKSEEYRECQHPAEKAAIERCGARVVWLRRRTGVSTSAAIAAMAGGV